MKSVLAGCLTVFLAGCVSDGSKDNVVIVREEPTRASESVYQDCMARYREVRSDCETLNKVIRDPLKRANEIAICLENRGFKQGHLHCKSE